MSPAELYETDFYEWTQRNAELLRSGNVSEADMAHVAEELEEMGRRERRALLSRAAVLAGHLLKWQTQPERRSRSWEATIRIQRRELAKLLVDMPSLKVVLTGSFEEVYRNAVLLAVADTNLPEEDFPSTPKFGIDQLLDEEFLP
jgi:hypothetical protein